MSAVLSRSPSGPRTEGDEYQNLVAWNKALNALIRERDVVAITVERPASGNVDDVVIERTDGSIEYAQVKHAVDAKTPVGYRWLTKRRKTGSKSLLQRFYDSYRQLSTETRRPDMCLITDRDIDPHDPVMRLRDQRSGLLVPDIQRTEADEGRRQWAAHLEITEDELVCFLASLRFITSRSFPDEEERARTLMLAAGLNDDQRALDSAHALIREWVQARDRRLTLAEFSERAEERIGRRRAHGALVVIEAIDDDPCPDDAAEVIRFVDKYIGDNPNQRRELRDPAQWHAVNDEIIEASERLRSCGVGRVVVRGAMRLPTWFAAGAAFRHVRGFEAAAMQGQDPWSSEDAAPMAANGAPSPVKSRDIEIGRGTDLAIAVGIATDPGTEALRYIERAELPVGKITAIVPKHGPGPAAVSSSADAATMAVVVRDAVGQALVESGAEHIHLFLAAPGALALLLGHRWNALRPTTVYEHLGIGRGYAPTFVVNS
ncbi:MAG: dsDNA nuclease domain-containing protein [Acidimicrobiaceae bacterium]|nr:dsDNA nuclease domain-containing protein [Acidimicrobiaceae bacterium]